MYSGNKKRPPVGGAWLSVFLLCNRTPNVESALRRGTGAVGSRQAPSRHTKGTTYRCFLPDLTRFMGFRCARPVCQHYLPQSDRLIANPLLGIHPAIADCRLQGTANSPCSTVWRRARDLNPRNAMNVNTISNRAPSATQPALHDQTRTIIKENG